LNRGAPIGVFDSGIGGLTVVREIMSRIPDEKIIYLGDTARVPYGVRAPETVRRYALEGAGFLLERDIKLLVVACNTVSAVGLDEIAAITDVPVLGVIEPGARAAGKSTGNGKVGVIGTEATVRSGAYAAAIEMIAPGAEVSSVPCPLFVPLVEEGWLEGEVPELVATKYLSTLKEWEIDTLVLGCTHYPLLKKMLKKVMGEGISLIDSAQETAAEVERLLMETDGAAGGPAARQEPPGLEICVTDSPGKFAQVGSRFLGSDMNNIKKVELEVHK
jgi:glutamate racemase